MNRAAARLPPDRNVVFTSNLSLPVAGDDCRFKTKSDKGGATSPNLLKSIVSS
jgi:hypothetical protein